MFFKLGSDKKVKDFPGQESNPSHPSKVTLLQGQPKIVCGLRQSCRRHLSTPIQIKAIDDTVLSFKGKLNEKQEQNVYDLGVSIDILCVDKERFIYTKVVSINPRYIICNKTDLEIEISQALDFNQTDLIL